jgi:sec-independent protein translocase protein TatA
LCEFFDGIYVIGVNHKVMEGILLFLGGVGMQEILVIGLFVLIFFGAKRIPEFMRGLGKGAREFKEGINGVKKDFEGEEEALKK